MPSFDPEYFSSNLNTVTDAKDTKESSKPSAKSDERGGVRHGPRMTVYLNENIHRRLKVAAFEDNRSMSEITAELIEKWLERNNR